MPAVTVLGAGGATVSLNFAAAANAAAAQAALNTVSTLVSTNVLTQVNYAGGIGTVPTPPTSLGGVVVTVGGANYITGLPGNNYASFVNSSTGLTMTAETDTINNPTVVSNGNLSLTNNVTNANIFLSGGINNITEGSLVATATIYDDGGTGSSFTQTNVGATKGTTTLVTFANSNITLNMGSSQNYDLVQPGTNETINVVGSSSSGLLVVNGSAGSNVTYNPLGGNGLIYPTGGNIVINAGVGNETLFGGSGPLPGLGNQSVPQFTGSATVISGEGYFRGGTTGNNFLTSGTVAGGASLIGGGSGDYIASYGVGNLIEAGTGNETLVSFTSPTAAGSTFIGGFNTVVGGVTTAANTTIYGAPGGGNYIGFQSGSSTVFGLHGSSGTVGDTYFEAAGNGTSTISDFISGVDKFSLSYSAGFEGSAPSIVGGIQTAGTGSFVKLSDGATINFLNTVVKTTDFS